MLRAWLARLWSQPDRLLAYYRRSSSWPGDLAAARVEAAYREFGQRYKAALARLADS